MERVKDKPTRRKAPPNPGLVGEPDQAFVYVCVRVCDYYPLTAIGLLWQTLTINWLNSQRNMPRDDSGVNYAWPSHRYVCVSQCIGDCTCVCVCAAQSIYHLKATSQSPCVLCTADAAERGLRSAFWQQFHAGGQAKEPQQK